MSQAPFFERATLAICGSLTMGEAMRDSVLAIRDEVPVDRMYLQVYEADLGAMRTIAMADDSQWRALNVLTPMPAPVRQRAQHVLERLPELQRRFPDGVVLIDDPERNPVGREMLRHHGLEGWSVLLMMLGTEGGRLGSMVLAAQGPDRYQAEHAERMQALTRPFAVAFSNALRHRELQRLRDQLVDDQRYLQRELRRLAGDRIVGADFGLREVMERLGQVAPTDSPVLLTGETGVGKDVIANAIHQASARRDGPFIAINCGAIPETLLDSELFGHERGAFTGALARKRGRFERAHGGTIFLDEIGEMPLSAQVHLLRVLQHKEVERIGGTERIPVDARIVAATNLDLPARVADGRFREDLWFRLNVFPIRVPPLRERPSDIPALVEHFVERKARELKLPRRPTLAPGAMDALLAYPWPGNVRELENLVERAIILHRGEPLSFDLAPQAGDVTAPGTTRVEGPFRPLDDAIREHVLRALAQCEGRIHGEDGAAALLGLNPSTLRGKMRKLGIPFGAGLARLMEKGGS